MEVVSEFDGSEKSARSSHSQTLVAEMKDVHEQKKTH